ncbi:enoyl-CoA hydratase/isomerase family protein [Porticoccaceae bacterium LTM1]|nr:enoyl-CoA hydratase/isomerase family protein [Porticoccaceae bacterium LTM1]
MATQPLVLFDQLSTVNGKVIGVATLNNIKALNALSLPMIEMLQQQLDVWREERDVVCVVLRGAGERAFCAGGDVVSLYSHAAAYGETLADDFGQCFFAAEYRLDYSIHTYPKPVVVLGSGVVMGGGIGLMVGASHRVVTESSRLAMPEVAIGLYPDVGASYFLSRLPGQLGRFLGLTGASFNGADAIFLGFADHAVPDSTLKSLPEQLTTLPWAGVRSQDSELLDHHFGQQNNQSELPVGGVQSELAQINACSNGTLLDVIEQIKACPWQNGWLQKSAEGLVSACPVSMRIVDEQLIRGSKLQLKQVFQMELAMSVNAMQSGHFKEGVRAALIDKDKAPKWCPERLDLVTDAEIEAFFRAPGWGGHPLADL